MHHPAVRAALKQGGFDFMDAKQFVARAFPRKAGSWLAVARSMPKASYDCPVQFLTDAMNCRELSISVRAQFAAALLPYQYRKLSR